MTYTIEARELTNESTHRQASDAEPASTMIEADGPDEALTEYARTNRSEVVSVTRPSTGRESIATVKKDDAVYLVRIYEN